MAVSVEAVLLAVASILSAVAACWAAWAGLRRARRKARAYCEDELDECRASLSAARLEAERVAAELHRLRM